jgi:hypothetical protein
MKLAWLFGSSMEARHLLYVYLSVWIIQSGYFAWVVWHWLHTKTTSPAEDTLESVAREDS